MSEPIYMSSKTVALNAVVPRILAVSPTPNHPTTAGNQVGVPAMIGALNGMESQVHLLFIRAESVDDGAMRGYHQEQWTSISYKWQKLPKQAMQCAANWNPPNMATLAPLLAMLYPA